MALREFADSLGRTWKAWDTYPRAADSGANKESTFSRYLATRPTEEGVQPTSVLAHRKELTPPPALGAGGAIHRLTLDGREVEGRGWVSRAQLRLDGR